MASPANLLGAVAVVGLLARLCADMGAGSGVRLRVVTHCANAFGDAKLNAVRLAANKKPLGFLNPFLYMHPEAFNDVTKGENAPGANKKYGFTAIPGWDAASGVGTPNYEALSKLV